MGTAKRSMADILASKKATTKAAAAPAAPAHPEVMTTHITFTNDPMECMDLVNANINNPNLTSISYVGGQINPLIYKMVSALIFKSGSNISSVSFSGSILIPEGLYSERYYTTAENAGKREEIRKNLIDFLKVFKTPLKSLSLSGVNIDTTFVESLREVDTSELTHLDLAHNPRVVIDKNNGLTFLNFVLDCSKLKFINVKEDVIPTELLNSILTIRKGLAIGVTVPCSKEGIIADKSLQKIVEDRGVEHAVQVYELISNPLVVTSPLAGIEGVKSILMSYLPEESADLLLGQGFLGEEVAH